VECSGSVRRSYLWEKGTRGSVSKKTNRPPKREAACIFQAPPGLFPWEEAQRVDSSDADKEVGCM